MAHLGRVEIEEPLTSTEKSYANTYMESATPDLWRNSDCFFKGYAFRSRFVGAQRVLQAELWIDVCVDPNGQPRWLRKIDVHVVRPDQQATNAMQELFQALQREIRRIRGPHT